MNFCWHDYSITERIGGYNLYKKKCCKCDKIKETRGSSFPALFSEDGKSISAAEKLEGWR